MFFYDKDMERMMQLKKQEIMREMEQAKKRILEELNCVKRSVHTDFCDLLADYNRIDFQMKQLLKNYETEIKKVTAGYSDLISLKFAEYNDMVVDKVEQLEILEREIELYFSNKQTELDNMKAEVQRLIDLANQYDEAIQNGASKEDLANLRTELVEMIGNVDVSDDLEQLRTDIINYVNENYASITLLQEFERMAALYFFPDWNAAEGMPGHISNRTHWVELAVTFDGNYSTREHVEYPLNEEMSILLVKVTDKVLTSDDLVGSTYSSYNTDGEKYIGNIYENDVVTTPTSVEVILDGVPYILSCDSDYITSNGVHFTRGTWFACLPGLTYVESVSCLPTTETVHKLHEKFLPNPDWNETDESKGTFILNKPEIAQSDWNESDETKAAFIKNKTHYGLIESVGAEYTLGDCLDRHVDSSVTGRVNIRLLNGNFSSWNETTVLHVVFGGWYECTLKGSVRNYAIYEPIKSQHDGTRIDSFYPVVNGLVFGDFDLSPEDLTTSNRIAIYQDPRDNQWYIAICNTNLTGKTLTINSETRSSVEKMLDCAYMGENGTAGKVLTHNGTTARWETVAGTSFDQSELIEMFTGNLTVKSTHSHGAIMNGVSVDFTAFDPNVDYYADVGYGCVKLSYESETVLTDHAYTDVVTLSDNQLVIDVRGQLKDCAPVGFETNGVKFTLYCVKTTKRATPIVIYSPSGNAYNLTVSDDGVLSATPVTTE